MLPLIDVREGQLHIKMVMHPKTEDAFTGWSTKKRSGRWTGSYNNEMMSDQKRSTLLK